MNKIEYLFKEPIYQPAFATSIFLLIAVVSMILIVSKIISIDYFLGYRAKAAGKILLWVTALAVIDASLYYYDNKLWVKPNYTEVTAVLEEDSLYRSIKPPKTCGRYKLDDGSDIYLDPCLMDNNHNSDGLPNKTVTLYKIKYKEKNSIRWFPWIKEYTYE